jgi:hypothetical protein
MEAWIRLGQPLEPVMDDFERIFDAWEAGGIKGLVFGRLLFADAEGGFTVPAFASDPEAYHKRGIETQADKRPRNVAKEKRLHAMLDDAKARGWQLMIFCPGQGTTPLQTLPLTADPYGARQQAAVWEEVFGAFPQADGGIMDGWTESSYELVFHHGNAVFAPLPETVQAQAEQRGWDPARLSRGLEQLHRRFHSFTRAQVRYYAEGGFLAGLNLFELDQDALYWLRWRREDGIAVGQAFRTELDHLPRRLLLANGPRSAVFSGMTGLDFLAWDKIVDILLVKHYFWHRGFDGMYGTLARWVNQLAAWNPDLEQRDCFAVAKAWLGLELPQVRTLDDMENGFPQAFFDEVVTRETRRALDAVSDPRKVMPWVDTGRMPHGGDPMTAADLRRILDASQGAGLQRFLFHNQAHLTAAEWSVISRLCGQSWDEDPEGSYWPPATPRPSSY